VRSDYGEPFDFIFSGAVCREVGIEDDYPQPMTTNISPDPPGFSMLRLRPGV
jgi:hypothetical protein